MRSEHPELAGPAKRCLGALATVSWPWNPAWGPLEPSRRGGSNEPQAGTQGQETAGKPPRGVFDPGPQRLWDESTGRWWAHAEGVAGEAQRERLVRALIQRQRPRRHERPAAVLPCAPPDSRVVLHRVVLLLGSGRRAGAEGVCCPQVERRRLHAGRRPLLLCAEFSLLSPAPEAKTFSICTFEFRRGQQALTGGRRLGP